MKLLVASDTFPPDVNGAARFTERLVIGMLGRGHEVHMIAPSQDGRHGTERHHGVVVHRIRSRRYPLVENFRICMPWSARPEIDRVLREVRPDVVHVQNHFLVGRYTSVLADRAGIPVVATNHFMPENLVDHARIPARLQRTVSRLAWRDLARIYRRADVLTAPTPRAVGLLESSAGLAGALAISCGIDSMVYHEAAARAVAHDVPVILFVGRLDQEKRVNELIQAVAALPADRAWRLEIIGDGAHRDAWKRLAAEVGVAERTTFLGFVSEEELVEAYGRCDIFCMPGVAELQSLVTLEAMSAGKPVVAANAMALPHLVHPGENGWLYEPGDVAELTTRLDHLLTHPEERVRMGRASLEIVAPHAIRHTLDRFEEVYATAVGRRAEGA